MDFLLLTVLVQICSCITVTCLLDLCLVASSAAYACDIFLSAFGSNGALYVMKAHRSVLKL